MPREKYKQKLMKHRLCSIARVISCASFLVLVIIGVSSLARAMSLESVEHQNGIPASWQVASLGNPDTITLPITYWDQREDACSAENRQFEWSNCRLYAKGIIPGVVQNQLGSDGLPVPSYTNSTDAWAAYHDIFTSNITGHNPVQTNDNFYRWFHETTDDHGKQLSKQYDREITFRRSGNNTYEYGSKGTFPLDDVDFSKNDDATRSGHNFHFTAHLQIPMKIAADGSEQFWFSGDDDVWVFLNGQLVLDLGGLHMDTEGSFTINQNGDVVSTVNNVNTDIECRQNLPNPNNIGNDIYNSRVESCRKEPVTTTIPTHFSAGDVVNLDFFYAERSTSESNTRITISNMQWPISADSNVEGKIEGKIENTESNLVEYTTHITNRDPKFPLYLERLSTYINDESSATNKEGQSESFTNSGFLPLSYETLKYTTTPNDSTSWQPVEISAPMNSTDGFTLQTPLQLSPAGQTGDTVYFRYFAETSPYNGTITNRTSFYTQLNGVSGVTFDHTVLPYTGRSTIDPSTDPDEPQTYDLNVTYVIDFGEAEPDPSVVTPTAVHQELADGTPYDIPSPTVPGFTPDFSSATGTINGGDADWTITYTKTPEETPEKQHVIIHYVKDDGTKAFPDHISEHETGETISVPSPELPDYTRSEEIVELTVPAGGLEHTVYYTPVKHTVTVHYVYSTGGQAFPDFVGEYGVGKEFSITSPNLDGFRKDIAVVNGIMGSQDREFTVTYTTTTPPVGPVIPDQPEPTPTPTPTPEPTPEEPVTPELPDENDNLIPSIPTLDDEDDLAYLPPLGEVAFVPNTGIISDIISPIFDQYFADIILSQGFVLTALLVFAGSFSTYFSLRKYLNLATATRATMRPTPKMPKSAAKATKSAKRTKTSARKSKK